LYEFDEGPKGWWKQKGNNNTENIIVLRKSIPCRPILEFGYYLFMLRLKMLPFTYDSEREGYKLQFPSSGHVYAC